METLRQFIQSHCRQVELGKGDVDIEFFGVQVIGEPDPDELRRLVTENKDGEFGDSFDLFDGAGHSYADLCLWIGSHSNALLLMALGDHLGLWRLLTPTAYLPTVSVKIQQQMARRGRIAIKAPQAQSAHQKPLSPLVQPPYRKGWLSAPKSVAAQSDSLYSPAPTKKTTGAPACSYPWDYPLH